jgi:release factor glutamine methyltransferase
MDGKDNQAVRTWKILDLLKVTEEHFRKNNIESPRLNAELLLSGTLNTKRINLYLDFEKPLTESELTDYREKIRRRLTGEPVQYILGEAEFYGLKFKVNPDVLIPRPETELLVDKALELIHNERLENPNILEIGTGSGCISIAVASKALCNITAIDISEKALVTASENSLQNNTTTKVTFEHKDFFKDTGSLHGYNLVISNPPYIAAGEISSLQQEVKDFEPLNALTDNEDGLSFYRKIFELSENCDKGTGILVEIGDGKKEKVEALLREHNITNYEFYKDLINIERVLYIKI